MLLEKANRINSNGFLVLYRNNDFDNTIGNIAKYYITIYLINPFELMDINLLIDRGTPLSNRLLNLHAESGYHLQNHFFEIISECERFLEKFYSVSWEGSLTYEQFEEVNNISPGVDAIRCNTWGDFGDYLKKILYNPLSGVDIWNGEVDHTNPYVLLELISQLMEEDQ